MGRPINSIEPTRLTLGVNWNGALLDLPVGAEVVLRTAAGKKQVDDGAGALYRPGGYAWWTCPVGGRCIPRPASPWR